MWSSFQGSILHVLLRDPLERIFSFFLSLSAIPRELIQHSDFLSPPTAARQKPRRFVLDRSLPLGNLHGMDAILRRQFVDGLLPPESGEGYPCLELTAVLSSLMTHGASL